MSASSSTPSPHGIAILVSSVGRFLQCSDCQLSFTFPDGAQFGTIAKQFGSYRCSSPMHIPAGRTDRRFIIVRYKGRVPAMASCEKCKRGSSRRQHSRATLLERRSTWDRSLMCMSVKSRRDQVMASRVVRCAASHRTNGKTQQYG